MKCQCTCSLCKDGNCQLCTCYPCTCDGCECHQASVSVER